MKKQTKKIHVGILLRIVMVSPGTNMVKSHDRVPVKKSLKLKMLGPLCNQTVNLRTDSKTLYYSILNVTTLRQQLKRGEF